MQSSLIEWFSVSGAALRGHSHDSSFHLRSQWDPAFYWVAKGVPWGPGSNLNADNGSWARDRGGGPRQMLLEMQAAPRNFILSPTQECTLSKVDLLGVWGILLHGAVRAFQPDKTERQSKHVLLTKYMYKVITTLFREVGFSEKTQCRDTTCHTFYTFQNVIPVPDLNLFYRQFPLKIYVILGNRCASFGFFICHYAIT